MLKQLAGFQYTAEAASVLAQVQQRASGAALFAATAPKPVIPQTPSL